MLARSDHGFTAHQSENKQPVPTTAPSAADDPALTTLLAQRRRNADRRGRMPTVPPVPEYGHDAKQRALHPRYGRTVATGPRRATRRKRVQQQSQEAETGGG